MHLANMPHVNDCRTGQEAIARARETEAKRRQMLATPKPRSKPWPISENVKKSPAQIAGECDPVLPAAPFPPIINIQKACCQYFDMPMMDVLSSRRFKPIVFVRHIAMYLATSLTPHSIPEIGRRFGGRDHSTVLKAVKKIELLRASGDQATCEAIEKLSAALVPTAFP